MHVPRDRHRHYRPYSFATYSAQNICATTQAYGIYIPEVMANNYMTNVTNIIEKAECLNVYLVYNHNRPNITKNKMT